MLMPVGNSSHEGLMLDWEQAMTRESNVAGSGLSPKESSFYNTSAHFLWVGDRTRQLDGAHVEYFRGIRNPIGIKVGPSLGNNELINLLEGTNEPVRSRTVFIPCLLAVINPNKESGRVTLITRYGAGKVRCSSILTVKRLIEVRIKIGDHLAGHIEAVKRSGHPVAWVCDPMHGKYVHYSPFPI